MDFITIDFEIANYNMDSACSLGMVFVKDNQIVDEQEYLIQPPNMKFNDEMTKIHGITADHVKEAGSFKDVWREIGHYFDGKTTIIAHNAQFDMSVLKNSFIKYSISDIEFTYLCSIPISTRACRGEGIPNSLKARCERFGVTLSDHHDALCDARACAELVIECVKKKRRKTLETYITMHTTLPVKSFSELKPNFSFGIGKGGGRKFNRMKVSDIKATTTTFNPSHPFFEKNIVLTGELENIDRKVVMQKIADVGGILKSGVSSTTDIIIVGKQDMKIVGESGMSSKERKAYDLIAKGKQIEIIKESSLLEKLDIMLTN